MMPVLRNIVDFSYDGEYLAYSSPDGCLKIWETTTNILKQEYTPSSHLSATCSSISWCPSKRVNHIPKKRKKIKDCHDFKALIDLQLIAMGTLTGDILLYSYVNADLHSYLSNGHTSIVNDICWNSSTCSLYSCSSDKNIVIWDVFTGEVKTKWKADNVAVHSICIIDNDHLLSASNLIKWWNIEQKTVIKSFTGHASEVFRLIPVMNDEKSENSYFLSAAVGDRVISAWQLSTEDNKRSVASFVVSDVPESISVIAKDGLLLLSVVSKDGSLHVFEHILNGFKKKPIHSKFCVQIAAKKSETHVKPERVPIICATLSLGLSSTLLSYGSFLKPTFEKVDLSEVSNDLFLIRNISISSDGSQEVDVTKIKHTDKSESIKLLAPGHLMPVKKTQVIFRKRKKKEADDRELPMEERLKVLDLTKFAPIPEEQETLKADSMVHILLQGLQSKNNEMINRVLQSKDEKIIQNTLRKLPLQSIILLLKELQDRLSKKEKRDHPYIKWMKDLLSIHLPYLMSCKDIYEYLGPINQLIQARTENFSKMCQLQGCLKILLSQTSVTKSEKVDSDKPALIAFESESEESNADDLDNYSCDEELSNDDSFEESSESESSDEDMVS